MSRILLLADNSDSLMAGIVAMRAANIDAVVMMQDEPLGFPQPPIIDVEEIIRLDKRVDSCYSLGRKGEAKMKIQITKQEIFDAKRERAPHRPSRTFSDKKRKAGRIRKQKHKGRGE